MVELEQMTFGQILEHPLIRQIAPDTVKNMEFSKESFYNDSLELVEKKTGWKKSVLLRGFTRLFSAAETGQYYYPLYTEKECAQDERRRGVNLVRLPSEDPLADQRPYLFLVPGGGYFNVWNLTEGWPIADHFNRAGYHVFILTYQVGGSAVLERALGDFARGISYIRQHGENFHVQWDRYMTCGFSAGGNLICMWSADNHGYPVYGLPKPQVMFPVYPVVSWKELAKSGRSDRFSMITLGMSGKEAAESSYNAQEHVSGFPPCALFLAAEDELVDPIHSKLLKEALDQAGIPCYMEIGETGGHGFGDGSGMCMEGWIERAIAWYENGFE